MSDWSYKPIYRVGDQFTFPISKNTVEVTEVTADYPEQFKHRYEVKLLCNPQIRFRISQNEIEGM